MDWFDLAAFCLSLEQKPQLRTAASFGKSIAQHGAVDMRTIMMTYAGFQTLPKGLKQMLVESENHFFEETTFIRRDGKTAYPFQSGASVDRLALGRQLSQSRNN